MPSHCLINKKLLAFLAHYRFYLADAILSEQFQQYRQIDQGIITII